MSENDLKIYLFNGDDESFYSIKLGQWCVMFDASKNQFDYEKPYLIMVKTYSDSEMHQLSTITYYNLADERIEVYDDNFDTPLQPVKLIGNIALKPI